MPALDDIFDKAVAGRVAILQDEESTTATRKAAISTMRTPRIESMVLMVAESPWRDSMPCCEGPVSLELGHRLGGD